MKTVVNRYGKEVDYDTAVLMMDDDIREWLHSILAPCTEQEFFDAYCIEHVRTYGEPWILDNPNPTW